MKLTMKRQIASTFITVLIVLMPSFVAAVPLYREVRNTYVKSDSLLLDRRGMPLHELRTDKEGRRLDWTDLEEISPALRQAVIKTEDKRFYEHGGLDYRAAGGALVQSLWRRRLRGASTITMQLAVFLDRDLQPRKNRNKTWRQKWRQIEEAREIEASWSKKQILEAYLNLVTFRGELQGVAAASRSFFRKSPHGLDRTEAAIMASLIRSPGISADAVLKRSQTIARSLNWQVSEADIRTRIDAAFVGNSFIAPRIALALHVAERMLKGKPIGASVVCTLDAGLQRFVLDRLAQQLDFLKAQNVCDGAVVVLHNATGQALAYAGFSAECSAARYVDGVQAKRQAGSTLKPFLYATAVDERILTASSVIDDAPLEIAVQGGLYRPRSYDAVYRGPVSVRTALASSLNIPAVLALNLVGVEPFLERLRRLGIEDIEESGDFYGPSLALGTADVTLWELTNAYRALANGGEWRPAALTFGRERSGAGRRIFSREAAFIISDILADREARSETFGLENHLSTKYPASVKTGTSKDMRDNWCVGYSSEFTVGVWIGNYSGASMWNVSGVSGAAPLWREIMNNLHRRTAAQKMWAPKGLAKARVADFTDPVKIHDEWFVRGTEPIEIAGSHPVRPRYNEKIIYPPAGTVIAFDPDIPETLQKIFFHARTSVSRRWKIDGSVLSERGATVGWRPEKGKHELVLLEESGRALDAVFFEVR